jgi:hypothetical protein
MSKNDMNEYLESIRQAIARETKSPAPSTKPSDILLAAREMMKKVKDKNGRSNQNNS